MVQFSELFIFLSHHFFCFSSLFSPSCPSSLFSISFPFSSFLYHRHLLPIGKIPPGFLTTLRPLLGHSLRSLFQESSSQVVACMAVDIGTDKEGRAAGNRNTLNASMAVE